MKKYFKILGLDEGATKKEIEAAYIRLSKDLNPEENDNLDFFVEEYNLVQVAYNKLIKIKTNNLEDQSKTNADTVKTIKESGVSKNSNKINERNLISVEVGDDSDSLIEKYNKTNNSNKSSVLEMFKLLAAKWNKACAIALHQINGIPLEVSDHLISIIVQGILSNPQACYKDIISEGKGEFGLSVSNPVPVYGIPSNVTYLSALLAEDGSAISWKRTGSTTTKNIKKEIDVYEIFNSNKKKISTIYISPYHWVISKKIPSGFLSKKNFKSNDEPKTKTKNKKINKNNDSKKSSKKKKINIILITIISILSLSIVSIFFYTSSKIKPHSEKQNHISGLLDV